MGQHISTLNILIVGGSLKDKNVLYIFLAGYIIKYQITNPVSCLNDMYFKFITSIEKFISKGKHLVDPARHVQY